MFGIDFSDFLFHARHPIGIAVCFCGCMFPDSRIGVRPYALGVLRTQKPAIEATEVASDQVTFGPGKPGVPDWNSRNSGWF